LPEASEGIMEWSELVVIVEVMFIDKSGVVVTEFAYVERVGRDGVGR
jgi:hypothetical protein